MCGVVGIFDFDSRIRVNPQHVHQMCDAIIHRGPDDHGYYIDKNVGIGMRRLSIIDVERGKQPISNEDDTIWIVFNGEIYNHMELRAELLKQGHTYKTNTDTETILHLYEQHGVECLEYLRGMFCFIIWDSKKELFFVARDRIGIKPCFWSFTGTKLCVASEMKSLLSLPWISNSIDHNGIDAFFAYTFIPAPITIYKEIHKLLPGHYMIARNGSHRIQRYWDLSFSNKFNDSEDKIAEKFLEILNESVRLRLMSEVPLGAFLSGGVDSGLIVALMSRDLKESVKAFNVSFGGETGGFLDERPYARMIADRYTSDYQEIEVKPLVETAMDAAVLAFDEPFADDSLIPTYHICEVAKKKVTVILTGLGGDENFAGYERHLGLWLSNYFEKLPGSVWRRILQPLVMHIPEQKTGNYRVNHIKRFVASAMLNHSQRYSSYLTTMPATLRRKLYSKEVASKIDFNFVDHFSHKYFDRLSNCDLIDRALYQDINMYLPDDILALSDRIGMHHSLELRVPFVDHKLIEFCARIPSRMKIKRGEKKYLLKKSSSSLLPKPVLNHKKQGFCSPMAIWLKTDLKKSVLSQLSPEKIEAAGIFDVNAVNRIINDHYSDRYLNDKIIFSLLIFQKWYEKIGV